MIIKKPNNLIELNEINNNIRRDSISPYMAFFRGQSQDWPIFSGVSRDLKYSLDEIMQRENNLLNDFLTSKHLGYNLQQHSSKDNYKYAQKWLNIFQAQHLGVKTRLTDWTQSYENALSFALQNKTVNDKCSILWVYKCPYTKQNIIDFNRHENYHFFNLDPYYLPDTMAVKHYIMSNEGKDYQGENRRTRQDGSFIILSSKDLKTPVEEIEKINLHLEKIIISPLLKQEILENYLNSGLENYLYDKSNEFKIEEFKKLEENIIKLNLKHFS